MKRQLPSAHGAAVLRQLLCMALLFAGWSHAEESAPDTRNIAGYWQLNAELSDDPRALMREMFGMPGDRTKRSGSSDGQRSRPPRGDMERVRGGGPGGQRRGGPGTLVSTTLTIEYAAPQISFTADDGYTRTWSTDGSGSNVSAGGEQWQQTAYVDWEGDTLAIEHSLPMGGARIERYRVDAESGRLQIEVTMDTPRFAKPLNYQLVYDRAQRPAESD